MSWNNLLIKFFTSCPFVSVCRYWRRCDGHCWLVSTSSETWIPQGNVHRLCMFHLVSHWAVYGYWGTFIHSPLFILNVILFYNSLPSLLTLNTLHQLILVGPNYSPCFNYSGIPISRINQRSFPLVFLCSVEHCSLLRNSQTPDSRTNFHFPWVLQKSAFLCKNGILNCYHNFLTMTSSWRESQYVIFFFIPCRPVVILLLQWCFRT